MSITMSMGGKPPITLGSFIKAPKIEVLLASSPTVAALSARCDAYFPGRYAAFAAQAAPDAAVDLPGTAAEGVMEAVCRIRRRLKLPPLPGSNMDTAYFARRFHAAHLEHHGLFNTALQRNSLLKPHYLRLFGE